jgi:hypothetical protein
MEWYQWLHDNKLTHYAWAIFDKNERFSILYHNGVTEAQADSGVDENMDKFRGTDGEIIENQAFSTYSSASSNPTDSTMITDKNTFGRVLWTYRRNYDGSTNNDLDLAPNGIFNRHMIRNVWPGNRLARNKSGTYTRTSEGI